MHEATDRSRCTIPALGASHYRNRRTFGLRYERKFLGKVEVFSLTAFKRSRFQARGIDPSQPDIGHSVADERGVLAAVDLDRVEAGVAGLAGDSRSVSAVAGSLGDEACTEGVPT